VRTNILNNIQFFNPNSVAVDALGNVYVSWDNAVRKISPAGVITLFAGNLTEGFSGDGGPATSAEVSGVLGIAVDTAGNLYLADTYNNRIRKVAAGSNMIGTFAGNGSQSFSGDGGPAISAQLFSPYGMAWDAAGDLYVADSGNSRIRKISAGGIITTIAGNGTTLFSGDGGPAVSAGLSNPQALVLDAAGNLYFSDSGSSRVRKISTNGAITTIAGNGLDGFSGDGGLAVSAELWGPNGLAFDAAGNLYIADGTNARVRKVTPSGTITTVAGGGTTLGDGGPASAAQLASPSGVAVDQAGNLYIADNGRIRKVSSSGTITTVAGNGSVGFSGDGGPALSAQISYVGGIAVDAAGDLFLADTNNRRIRMVTPDGVIQTIAGSALLGFSGEGVLATLAQMNGPLAVTVAGATGNVYVADSGNNAIRLLQPAPPQPPPPSLGSPVEAAGYQAFLSPGGIASVFGTNLATSTANAGTVPLPTTMGGTNSLMLAGTAVPLFYVSPAQINFQVPWEFSAFQGVGGQVITPGGGSNNIAASVVPAVPGVFTVDSSGSGQGVVTLSSTGQLANTASPALRGQYVTIYCSGLGLVSNQPATGAAARSLPLSNTLLVPTVTIGGLSAAVSFSGLVPNLVGLYQVNAQISEGVEPGPAVALRLYMNGMYSNLVTIAVQ
jgi:uncharacterized protein (TIGR03437 family)